MLCASTTWDVVQPHGVQVLALLSAQSFVQHLLVCTISSKDAPHTFIINSPNSTDESEYFLISMIFVIFGRGFAAIALSATIQMTCEIFPTVVRSQGVAIASAVGMATSFLSPFIIHSVS